jgi:hypothetical protein
VPPTYAPPVGRRGDVAEELDGELPGGLWFTDDEPVAPPAHAGAWRVLTTVVLLALVGGAVLAGVRWTASSDVRDVLASSTRTYTGVLTAVSRAADPQALGSAAALAPRAVQRLEADLARLRPEGGSRRNAVAAQVEAERDVLEALAPLERIADGPLEVWGAAHADLTAAVDDPQLRPATGRGPSATPSRPPRTVSEATPPSWWPSPPRSTRRPACATSRPRPPTAGRPCAPG